MIKIHKKSSKSWGCILTSLKTQIFALTISDLSSNGILTVPFTLSDGESTIKTGSSATWPESHR